MEKSNLVSEMARVGDLNAEQEVYVRTDEGGDSRFVEHERLCDVRR